MQNKSATAAKTAVADFTHNIGLDRRTFLEYTVYEAALWYTPGQL